MHGEFLRLLFLQAHIETTAHFHATGLPSQQNRSDNVFRFKCTAFYMGLKSKVGLVAAIASALRINLNIQGCSLVTPSPYTPSRDPLLLPLLLSHNLPPYSDTRHNSTPLWEPDPASPGGRGSSRRGRGMGGQNGPQADTDVQ